VRLQSNPLAGRLVVLALALAALAVLGFGFLSAATFTLLNAKGWNGPISWIVGILQGLVTGVYFPITLLAGRLHAPAWLRPPGPEGRRTRSRLGVRRAVHWRRAISHERPEMSTAAERRFTSADLELLQHDNKRYEIIDGELYVSSQPSWSHQTLSSRINTALQVWSYQTGAGQPAPAPGLIFSDDNDVAPDLIWISNERLAGALDAAGHLHTAPELVVEILSPGLKNERRDRSAKLDLYSRRGVNEYWIADPAHSTIEVYRRQHAALHGSATLQSGDTLETPLLPGFSVPLDQLFGHA
jgi:Uma2 family endonuclease